MFAVADEEFEGGGGCFGGGDGGVEVFAAFDGGAVDSDEFGAFGEAGLKGGTIPGDAVGGFLHGGFLVVEGEAVAAAGYAVEWRVSGVAVEAFAEELGPIVRLH